MRKMIVISLLVCLVLSLAFSSALAQPENDSVVINPYLSDPVVNVSMDQDIILGARWGACRRGLVQSFFSAVHLDWSLTLGDTQYIDPLQEMDEYWGPIEQDASFPTSACQMKTEAMWLSYWRYPLGQLGPGDYELHLHYWLDHPVIDGIDNDEDGKLDRYQGTLKDVTIIIHVEP
jgi:hypothetical protein